MATSRGESLRQRASPTGDETTRAKGGEARSPNGLPKVENVVMVPRHFLRTMSEVAIEQTLIRLALCLRVQESGNLDVISSAATIAERAGLAEGKTEQFLEGMVELGEVGKRRRGYRLRLPAPLPEGTQEGD